MRRIVISFLSLMLIFGIGVGISQIVEQKRVIAEETSTEEFIMDEGAAFRSYWSTPNCGIRFSASINIDSSNIASVKLLIAPYDYLESIRETNKSENIDYVSVFTAANKKFLLVNPATVFHNDKVYFFGGVKNIQKGNENRRFFGIFFYENQEGRVYAEMPNGEIGQARSIAYLSSAFYNDATNENDKYMTNYWMEMSIKAAVRNESGKNGNPVVDANTIKYIDNAERNTIIKGGRISGTYFDDYLNIGETLIQVDDVIVDVRQRLDFKMDYTPFEEYFNQNNKKGQLVNITKVVNEVIKENVMIGLENNASYSLTINHYDLTNAELSSLDTTFIDTISGGNEVVDTYNDTIVSPSTTLIIPKGANMLAQKEIDKSLFTDIGSVSYGVSYNGANGDNIDASTDIVVNGTSTLVGNINCINSVTGTFNATKNKFTLSLENYYSDTYNSLNGSVALSGIIKNYYYKQSHSLQTITGYTSYLDEKRAEQVNNIEILDNTTEVVYYMPNTYKAFLNCKIDTDIVKTIETKIKYDYPFTLNAPNIEGYTPTQTMVGPYFMTDTNGCYYTIEYSQTLLGEKSKTHFDSTNSTNAKFYKITDGDLTNSTKGTYVSNGGYSHKDNSDNWDKYFVGVGKEIDYFSKAATFNFEFEFKYGEVGSIGGNNETASRFIITFAPASGDFYGDMFGISINLGASDNNNSTITPNAINFLSQDVNGNDVYTVGANDEIVLSNYIPNFNIKDGEWHKISVYKFDYNERGCVNLSIDDYRICEAHLVDNGALSNLFGEVYFGIQAYCTSYDIRNANYSFGEGVTEGNIGLPINDAQIRRVNNGEIVSNDTSWAGNSGVQHGTYGYTSYLFGEEGDVVLQGKSVYYEFNLNLNDIYPGDGSIDSEEKASKFLCIFGKEGGSTLFGAYLVLGATAGDGNYAGRTIQNVGFAKLPPDDKQHLYSPYIGLNNSVNYQDTIKIGCYKYVINNTAVINLYINDTLVAKSSDNNDVNNWFTNEELVGNVRFGLKGYRVNYSISNAKYICSDNDRLRIQETKMSNTIAQENFYYEAKVQANAYMPGNYELQGDTSLGGIVVQSVENTSKQWYFYIEINDGDSLDAYNRRVGLVPVLDGVPQWKSEYKNYYNNDQKKEMWKRAESIVYVSPTSNSFIDTDGNLKVVSNNVGNVLSVYKTGETLVFMLNGVPYLFVDDTDFTRKASVGFRTDGYSLSFSDTKFITDQEDLIKIAKERSIITNETTIDEKTTYEINDGITFDGFLSEDKWQIKELDGKEINVVRCSDTATNREGYNFRAFLGKNFLYVGIEAYSLSCYGYEGGVVLDEEKYRILWHNFNIEISGIRNGEISQTAFNVIGINLGVANFGFKIDYDETTKLYKIVAEVAIPYESFGLSTGASLVEDITFAVRPGLDGNKTSASYKSDTPQDGYYTDAHHYFNAELGGKELEQNIIDQSGAGYWWNNGKIYYVNGTGVGILGSRDAEN